MTDDEFSEILDLLYAEGGSPEYVIGRCPYCGQPFEFSLGELLQGHFPSECHLR